LHLVDWLIPSEFQPTVSARLSLALIHFLWQGCVIACVALTLQGLLRRVTAAVRYWVHVIALGLMVGCVPATFVLLGSATGVPVQVSVAEGEATVDVTESTIVHADVAASSRSPIDLPAAAGDFMPAVVQIEPVGGDPVAVDQVSAVSASTQSLLTFRLHGWSGWLAAAYGFGVLAMLVRLSRSLLSGHELKTAAVAITEGALLTMIHRQAKCIGLKVAPTVRFCECVAAPTVIGVLRPVVLLPLSVATGLTPQQLEPLLAHEFAHIRRFDLCVNLLQRLIEAFLFFHPAVWIISRRVSMERENACDDLVLGAGWQRVNYADALVRMAEISSTAIDRKLTGQAIALAASGRNSSELKRRVMRVLSHDEPSRLKLTRAGLTTLFASLIVIALAPFVVPTFADSPSPERGADATVSDSGNSDRANEDDDKSNSIRSAERDYRAGKVAIDAVLKEHLARFKLEIAEVDSTADRIAVHRRRIERLKKLSRLEAELLKSGKDTSRRKPPAGEDALWKAEFQLDGVLAAYAHHWDVLYPHQMELDRGEKATVLQDSSILFESPGPEGSDSRFIFNPDDQPVTHFRFETLNHKSLPGGGPGRSPDGSFLLFALELYHVTPENAPQGEYIEIRTAYATDEDDRFPVSSATDFLSDTSWVAPSAEHPHEPVSSVLELYEPLKFGPDDRLAVKIDTGYDDQRMPGRVRISVASSEDSRQPGTVARTIATQSVRLCFTAGEKKTPLPGLQVIADRESYRVRSETFEVAASGTTDKDGVVTLDLPQGAMYFRLDSSQPIPYLRIPHGYTGHPGAYSRWIEVLPGVADQTFDFNLAEACELSIRIVDERTGKGIPGAKIGTENAVGEMWMQVLVPECIGANRPPRHFNSPGVRRTSDEAAPRGSPPESDYETDKDGYYRVHVGPREGWTYMIYSSPDEYEQPGIQELELKTPPGGRVKHIFKLRRKDAALERQAPDESEPDSSDDAATAPTGPWGHITGRFVLDGNFPSLPPLPISRDRTTLGESTADESLVVDSKTLGIANVGIYVRTKDVAVHPDYAKTASKGQSLQFKGPAIHPRLIPVRVGQPVIAKNANVVAHNAHFRTVFGQGSNVVIPPGQSIKIELTHREPVPIHITDAMHPFIQAWAIVTEHPYAAATNPDGTFEIRNLPAGELEFQCWHERAGFLAAQPEWKRGRFKINVEAGKTHDLGTIRIPVEQLKRPRSLRPREAVAASTVWGKPVKGVQAGLAYEFGEQQYQLGQNIPLLVRIRNHGDRPVDLLHAQAPVWINLNNYRLDPGPAVFLNQDERILPYERYRGPAGTWGVLGLGTPNLATRLTVLPNRTANVGRVLLPVRSKEWLGGSTVNVLAYRLPAGTHGVSLTHSFNATIDGAAVGDLTTGRLKLRLIEPQAESDADTKGREVADWMPVSNGIRMRTWTPQRIVSEGDPVLLFSDIQNVSGESLRFNNHKTCGCIPEVDGERLVFSGPITGPVPPPFTRGIELINVPTVLPQNWHSREPFKSIALKPGKHSIRVIFTAENDDGEIVEVTGQSIEIEVTPAPPVAPAPKEPANPPGTNPLETPASTETKSPKPSGRTD